MIRYNEDKPYSFDKTRTHDEYGNEIFGSKTATASDKPEILILVPKDRKVKPDESGNHHEGTNPPQHDGDGTHTGNHATEHDHTGHLQTIRKTQSSNAQAEANGSEGETQMEPKKWGPPKGEITMHD